MSNSIQNLISENLFEIEVDSTNENLTCLKCKKVMNDAYQTSCGCQYCFKCIKDYLVEKEQFCLGNKDDCKDDPLVLEKNVLRNPMLNKQISKLKFHCPNQFCEYYTELKNMGEHLLLCSKNPIQCPYVSIGCTVAESAQDSILAHINSEALSHANLLMSNLKIYKDNSDNIKLTFTSMQSELKTNNTHFEEQKKETENLRDDIKKKEKQIEELLEEMIKIKKELEFITEESKNIKNNYETLKDELMKVKNMEPSNLTITKHKETINKRIDKLENQIGKINKKKDPNNLVTVCFLVDKYNERKSVMKLIQSPHFYSHTNGYKFKLLVEPGGYNDGRGTHLSIFFAICKGEFDDLLSWPCKYLIKIGLINQSTGDLHASQSFDYTSCKDHVQKSFSKPLDKDNSDCGLSKFITNTDLETSPGLLVNDSIIIKCSIYDNQ